MARPIIGILSQAAHSSYLEDLIKKAHELGAEAYVFRPSDMHGSSVSGYTLAGPGRDEWRRKELPLPTVLYDRSFFKGQEALEASELRQRLVSQGTPFVNPIEIMSLSGNKIRFAQAMQEDGVEHPMTKRYTRDNARQMMNDYNGIVLKPVHGKEGKGILFLDKGADGAFKGYFKHKVGDSWSKVFVSAKNTADLDRIVTKVRKDLRIPDDEGYLLQEKLKFYEHNGKQTDFRVIMQRDDHGMWKRTAIGVRVGGNLSQDGDAQRFSEVCGSFAKKYGFGKDEVMDMVRKSAEKAYLAMEKKCGKKAGEVGIDLVLAKRNGRWKAVVVEANSKPGHTIFGNLDLNSQYDTSLERVIGYAKHLSSRAGNIR